MIKTISKEKTYIPKFDNNRDLPASDQIKVRYRSATTEIKNRVRAQPVAVGKFDNSGNSEGMEITIKNDDIATLKAMTVNITNAGYREEDGEEPIYIKTAGYREEDGEEPIYIKTAGYREEDGEEPIYIKTAADLLKAPIEFEPLIKELIELYNKELDGEVNEKNSE